MLWKRNFICVIVLLGINFSIAAERTLSDDRTELYEILTEFISDNSALQDSFPIIKNDFIVNDITGPASSEQSYPSMARDSIGNYLIAWCDYRSSTINIYAQMYDKLDRKVGSNIKLSEDNINYRRKPTVLASKKGDFAVVWPQSSSTLIAQRISPLGEKIGDRITINTYSNIEASVSGAMNNDGSFLVVAETYIVQNELRSYLVSKDNVITSSILNTTSSVYISTYNSRKLVDVDENGNYIIVWSSGTSPYNYKIVGQVVNKLGYKVGSNFQISSDTSNQSYNSPSVISTNNGYRFVYWTGGQDIYYRILRGNNSFVTDEKKLTSANYMNNFSASTDRNSLFMYLWQGLDERFGLIDTSGTLIKDSVKVLYSNSSNKTKSHHFLSNIFGDRFYLTFILGSMFDGDCVIQKYDTTFTPLSPTEIVNDDSLSSSQILPVVKFNNSGKPLFIWNDQRNGTNELFGALYDSNFVKVASDIKLNDYKTAYHLIDKKAISSFTDGTFLVAFVGYNATSGWLRLDLQRIDTNGNKLGSNIKVDSTYNNYYNDLKLNINSNDEILIAWYGSYGITIYKYSKNLSPIFKRTILQTSDSTGYNPIGVSIDNKLNVFVAWKYYNLYILRDQKTLHGRFYNLNSLWSPIIRIDSAIIQSNLIKVTAYDNSYAVLLQNHSELTLIRYYSEINEFKKNVFYTSYSYNNSINLNIAKFFSHKILLTYNSPTNVFAAGYDDNIRQSFNFLLHTYENIDPYAYSSIPLLNSSDINNGKFIFTYHEVLGNTGYDIYAKVINMEKFESTPDIYFPAKNKDYLYNNFPNPFNSKTKIAYQILTYGKVKLTVFDILGNELKVLVDEYKEAGVHTVDFESGSLASGIYFYKLEAFDVSVNKMVILK